MIRLPRISFLVLAVACGASLAACVALTFDRVESAEPSITSNPADAADGDVGANAGAAEWRMALLPQSPLPATSVAEDGSFPPRAAIRRRRPDRRRGTSAAPSALVPESIQAGIVPPKAIVAEAAPMNPPAEAWASATVQEAATVPRAATAARWIAQPDEETSPGREETSFPEPEVEAEVAEELPLAAPAPAIAAPSIAAPNAVRPPRQKFVLGEGDDGLAIDFVDEDIRNVLNGLSEAGGFNVVVGQSVQGTVSASLHGASIEEALDALLKSTGYVGRWEGNFLYVGTPAEFQAIEQLLDTIGTRVYRPNYVTAEELKKLIAPLMTPEIGRSETTSPAKQGIQNNVDEAEGNNFAGADALLVQDYECVLSLVDQIVAEVDRRPVQVAIEAMILSVRLDDTHQMGVDFEFLRNSGNVAFGTGEPLQDLAEVTFDGGLKFAYLDGNFAAFLDTLESIGETNVIATPRLMVLNKHRAQILIGSELGYVSTTVTETSTSQTVEFLQVGTQLRLRPFVSDDGRIRMEIHPELSTGVVSVQDGFTLPEKEVTEVTTNVMIPDGATMVLGGLMREDLVTTTTQVPWAGSLPVVGALFRRQEESVERREILVLVTPRIVYEPEAAQEGHQAASEFHRRQSVYADQMSPFGKRHLGRKYFRMAQEAWAAGDGDTALRYAEMAVHFDPMNRAAIDLRSDIWAGSYDGDHSLPSRLQSAPPLEAIDGPEVAPWIIEELAAPPPRVSRSAPREGARGR